MFNYKWHTRHSKERTLRVRILEALENIEYFYYHVVPYNWRPSQIIYQLKCWVWYRYKVVNPKTIKGYGWVDRIELLPHVIFQVLTDFVEQECGPNGHIDWYHEEYPKKIIPGQPYDYNKATDPKAVWIRDEMDYLVNWWHNIYLKERESCHDEWHEFIKKHQVSDDFFGMEPIEYDERGDASLYEWNGPKYKSQEIEREADRLFEEGTRKEQQLEKELQENMVRVVYLTPFLWT